MTRTRTRTMVAVLVALALVAVAMLVAVLTPRGAPPEPPSLEEQVRAFTDRLGPRGPYRPPEPAERDAVVEAVAVLLRSGADRVVQGALEDAGFTVGTTRNAAGAEFLVARSDPESERSWGLIALPLGRAPRLIVEVPHPNADYDTENVGTAVLAAAPDAVYLQAGAHRRADDERADVAHEEGSLFHALSLDLSTRLRLPQLQLHGFADRDALDADVVLGGGPDDPEPAVRALGDRIEGAGLAVCRAWDGRCSELEGRTNVQGRAAALFGLPFAHVEMNASTRSHPEKIAPALATLGS